MKQFFLGLMLSVFIGLIGQEVYAQDEVFSAEQQSVITALVSQFANAMSETTLDPLNNCPGLREVLRAKITEVQPLAEFASSLPTDVYSSSTLARNVLEAELAYNIIDGNCSSHGV